MEYQSSLHKKLSEGEFVYTAETTPPDASNQGVLLTKIMSLKGIADAINVTDGPGAKVHMSSLAAAIILYDLFELNPFFTNSDISIVGIKLFISFKSTSLDYQNCNNWY